jgi:TolA-binding protein
MMRLLLLAFVVGLALALGFLAGYLRWEHFAGDAQRAERELRASAAELSALHTKQQTLEQQLEEVNKEQQRLAQENEILRKQLNTERLVTGRGVQLPALPPK